MTEKEKLQEAQLQAHLTERLAYTMRAALGEVLGRNIEKFHKYFQVRIAELKDEPGMAIIEQLTGREETLFVFNEALLKDTDAGYYSEIKKLAQLVSPLIPDEEKDIPKDIWPEPQWEESESKRSKGD